MGFTELLRAFGSNQIKGHDLMSTEGSTDPISTFI